jgi:hypothetical protein
MTMLRFAIAFLIAPLAIPIIEFPPWNPLPMGYGLLMVPPITIIAYAGTFLFGIPAYFLLRDRKWAAFGFAPVAGFIVAALVWWLVGIFVIWRGGNDLLDVHRHVDWLRSALWPYGPLGALVATLLWVMTKFESSREP